MIRKCLALGNAWDTARPIIEWEIYIIKKRKLLIKINYIKMSDEIIFEEDNLRKTQLSTLETNSPSGLIGLVMKMGLANNIEKANYVLLGIFAITLVIAVIVLIFSGTISLSSKPSGPDKATLERMMQPPPQ